VVFAVICHIAFTYAVHTNNVAPYQISTWDDGVRVTKGERPFKYLVNKGHPEANDSQPQLS
jgi:hypothetical protein